MDLQKLRPTYSQWRAPLGAVAEGRTRPTPVASAVKKLQEAPKGKGNELWQKFYDDAVARRHPMPEKLADTLLRSREHALDIASQKGAMVTRMKSSGSEDGRLAALWTLFSAGLADDAVLYEAADASLPSLRMWAARFTGENNRLTERVQKRLELLATDENPTVLAAVATALRQFSGGSLTVNTPPSHDIAVLGPLVTAVAEKLLGTAKASTDRDLPFLLWMALEPNLLYDPNITAAWFQEKGERYLPLSGKLAYKMVRRFCDARKDWLVDKTLEIVASLDSASPLIPYLLDGLIDGQRGKALAPTQPTEALLQKLLSSSNLATVAKARQLGALWGDVGALRAQLARVSDTALSEAERLEAIQGLRNQRGPWHCARPRRHRRIWPSHRARPSGTPTYTCARRSDRRGRFPLGETGRVQCHKSAPRGIPAPCRGRAGWRLTWRSEAPRLRSRRGRRGQFETGLGQPSLWISAGQGQRMPDAGPPPTPRSLPAQSCLQPLQTRPVPSQALSTPTQGSCAAGPDGGPLCVRHRPLAPLALRA